MLHSRWYCHGCHREWVYAHHWHVSDGCPICRGDVTQETYDAAFPGADLPRSGVSTPPPLTERAALPTIEAQRSAVIAMQDETDEISDVLWSAYE